MNQMIDFMSNANTGVNGSVIIAVCSVIGAIFIAAGSWYGSKINTENQKEEDDKRAKTLQDTIVELRKENKEKHDSLVNQQRISLQISKRLDSISNQTKNLVTSNQELSKEAILLSNRIQTILIGVEDYAYIFFGSKQYKVDGEWESKYYVYLKHSGFEMIENLKITVFDKVKYFELLKSKNINKNEVKRLCTYERDFGNILPRKDIAIEWEELENLFSKDKKHVAFDADLTTNNFLLKQRFRLLDIWGYRENATDLRNGSKVIWSDCYDDFYPRDRDGEIIWTGTPENLYRRMIKNINKENL